MSVVDFHFDSAAYGIVLSPLLQRPRLNTLDAGTPHEAAQSVLSAITVEQAFAPHSVRDRDAAECCLSGLWLLHDFLHESHEISQGLSSPTASFWHAIMHRRDGDFGNAKYWNHRVGRHPVYASLGSAAANLVGARPEMSDVLQGFLKDRHWDADRFVDLCEEAVGTNSPLERACERLQRLEWEMLFDFGYRKAISG